MARTLMVTAAEIDISMSVRTLEELTYVKSMGDGLFSIQMRPNYNVIVATPAGRPIGSASIFTSNLMFRLRGAARRFLSIFMES